jgi:hypothetical protein
MDLTFYNRKHAIILLQINNSGKKIEEMRCVGRVRSGWGVGVGVAGESSDEAMIAGGQCHLSAPPADGACGAVTAASTSSSSL